MAGEDKMPWQKLFGVESTATLMTMPVDLDECAKVRSVIFWITFGCLLTVVSCTVPGALSYWVLKR